MTQGAGEPENRGGRAMKLYVLVPDDAFAQKVREEGGIPARNVADIAEPVAQGRTGTETLAEVRRLVKEGKSPVARGGLDRDTLARCREAGAVGFVLDAALALLPESPTPQADKDALAKLTARDFAAGDATLPSGARVGRDALLAPFVAKRSGTLARALADIAADAARPVAPQLPPAAPAAQAPRATPVSAIATPPLANVSADVPAGWPFETRPHEEAVAIIGMGVVLPTGKTPDELWRSIVEKRNGIIEVPAARWDAAVHFDDDHAKPDKTYARIGAFVTDFTFDPMRFRIPPTTVNAIDEVQKWTLTASADALHDAGYDVKPFDRSRCAVILGNALGGEKKDQTTKRMHVRELAASLRATSTTDADRARIDAWEQAELAKLPVITEDTMPGELSNVIAGRVANVLNLTGKNLTTDAACASSHAALDVAVKAILGGEADMVLCGGVDRTMDPATYVKFSKIGALSATGSFPFDARADGFVMGEGCAILLLKRLSTAVGDGDRIYAVIRGIGASSDGKGKGITAPNPEGQKLAVKRALDTAQVLPKHVQLVEAHGTSTKVGDVVEVESLATLYAGLPVGSVALGSIKSQIGHLKSAAGAAGLAKVALALHHKTLPPSANFETPNPNVKWNEVPFKVITEAKPWTAPSTGEPRRAAVSSFGFGGTNFHVILEEFLPAYHGRGAAEPRGREGATPRGREGAMAPRIEAELVVLGADTPEALALAARAAASTPAAATLADTAARMRTPGAHTKPHRLALGATEHPTLVASLEGAAALVGDPKGRAALPLKVKGAAYGAGPRHAGKIAFLFPGQGSQYVNMMGELALRYPVVRATFEEADVVLEPLIGCKLTSLLFQDPKDKAALMRGEEALRQTEVTQPAMLAADVAMLRLLAEHNVRPDMVAGHSLGEYAALVAGGVLSFKDALLAVSARGKEMASVKVPDMGLMASFSCSPEKAEEVLRTVEGYVVAANKNCPVQTVIAGETAAVKKAVDAAKAAGIDTMLLPVSAAFHTSIVAPASQPLRRVLDRLEFRAPTLPVYTNVDATLYPSDPDTARDILSRQVAAPVEWVKELDALYEAGARIFIEVGPKRALAGFVDATIGTREGVVSLFTNHPKRGDLGSWFDATAKLAALGFDLGLRHDVAPAAAPPVAPLATPSPARTLVHEARPTLTSSPGATYDAFRQAVAPALEAALKAGYDAFAAELARLQDFERAMARFGLTPVDVVVSGAALGLPGASRRVFDDNNFDRLLSGENRIDRLDATWADRFLEKDIVRLVKDGGEPRMESVKDAAETIKLAGRKGALDLVADYGVDGKLEKTLDVTSKLALAAAYEALHDAGIPLVREQKLMSNGKTVPGDWVLPASMQADTGIVFASAFPGYDNFARELAKHFAKRYAGKTVAELDAVYHGLIAELPDEKRAKLSAFYAKHRSELQRALDDAGALESFNRHFLFSVLSLGHAEVAEALHARGPNTQVNAACASTTQAVAIAEDWLRTGRARRVLVLGADDATSDHMMEWIGSGFLASGAATTAASVEEGALPFDRRRHGMIIGMGAVGLVIEPREDVEARGMTPLVRIVATRIANSAYHGSRLDVHHLAGETRALVESAAARLGVPVGSLGERTLFVSHETYTPARGGSASAEAAALRAAFGASASKVLVTNTKGFTGHAMGAGLEDALAVKALQTGRVPPIANLRDTDPEFADLQLSRGGTHDRRYAVRFAAGFGSQIAITFLERIATGPTRVTDPRAAQAFLDACSGLPHAVAQRVGRQYRITSETKAPGPAVAAPVAVLASPVAVTNRVPTSSVLERVIALVAEKTGYPQETLDPTLDMEADLGIDTVKQAEIFGILRESYGIARDENLKLKDVPTLGKVAEYLSSRLGNVPAAPEPVRTVPVVEPARAAPAPAAASSEQVLDRVIALVAEKTGYPRDALDPSLDMEADLGIDTVKQAEIFGQLREGFGIPRDESLTLKDINTLGKVAAYLAGRVPRSVPAPAPALGHGPDHGTRHPGPAPGPAAPPPQPPVSTGAPTETEALARILDILAAKTGYPKDVLDPSLDMEADLGIDTVKQAEVFGEVREAFGIPRIDGLQIKDYPTIQKVAGFVVTYAGSAAPASASAQQDAPTPSAPVRALTRRAPRVRDAPAPEGAPRSAFVVGSGAFADALRSSFPTTRGDVAVFVGAPRDLFLWARANAAALEAGTLGVLVVSQLGGRQGIEGAVETWQDGGLTGLAKALAAEFPKAWVRSLDLDPREPMGARVAHVRHELAVAASPVEVGRTNAGRIVVETIALGSATPAQPQLPEGTVVVVTGGARGITAEILKALAPSRPTLVLLGRTEAPQEGDESLDDATLARLKDEAKAALLARGERATPVAIERAVAPRKARAEIMRTLHALREAGARVEYAACDAGDEAALERVLSEVRARHGRIDGVLHAAGVEESKRLADKDEAAFDRAWLPKAHAAGTLARLTAGDTLKFFVMFGSVAGRYGNAAQADYSAANDALAKLARTLRARGTQAAVLCWGPWGEAGMATRGSTLTVLKALGVDAIATDEGVGAFLTELATLDEPEVVLAKSLGALAPDAPTPTEPEGRSLALHANEPALNDHRVDGVPYLAGVMGLQAFTEAAPFEARAFEDVHFAYPVKLLRDQSVEARVIVGDDGAATLQTTPPGPAKAARTHFTARILPDGAPAADVPEALMSSWTFDAIYPPFFHGPAFRVLARATHAGLDALRVEGAQPAPGIPAQAATLEGALQALGLWGLAVGGVMALPERIARVALSGSYQPEATVYEVRNARIEDARVKGDVHCLVAGRAAATLTGVSLVVTGPAGVATPPQLWTAEPVHVGDRTLVRVPIEDARDLLAKPALLSTYLSPREREVLAAFPVEKRREEWLAATLAAKVALGAREWRAVEVLRGADGAPLPPVTLSHAAGVAVACVFDPALERVGVDVERVEARAGSFEEEAFTAQERAAFPSEPGARAQAVTVAWAAKEAVLKALGTGLSLPLHSVQVRVSGTVVEVDLADGAKERFVALDGGRLTAAASVDEATATALATVTLVKRT